MGKWDREIESRLCGQLQEQIGQVRGKYTDRSMMEMKRA